MQTITDRAGKTVAERVQRIRAETDGVKADSGIDSWTDTFLSDIAHRGQLTPKQETKLREIEVTVFGEAYDPHTGDLFS